MSPRRALPTLVLAVALAAAAQPAPADAQGGSTKLLRFPDIHGDRVAFVYAGDVWLAPADGGTARRLTSHPGIELFPKFSPDGEWIAFTGQYDGDEQVYVVPTAGGVPEQLTFYPASGPLPPRWGYDNQVYGWTADGTRVLFRSMRDGWDLTDTQLFTVSVEGG
ncbi:MAG TPA: peptidase S41, partial [Thermoanaerobaculia bacterium]|nr:peptidase S41 [Thermoanaerobaculia bacterium]